MTKTFSEMKKYNFEWFFNIPYMNFQVCNFTKNFLEKSVQ